MMTRDSKILQELRDLDSSILANASRDMPFAVPVGYFQDSAEALVAAVRDAETVPSFGRIAVPEYSVPDGYFEQNLSSLVALAKDELPLDVSAPELVVPDGYFDTFPAKVLELAKTKEPSKVIPFRPVYTAKRNIRLAAAMVAFLIAGYAGLKWFSPTDAEPASATVNNINKQTSWSAAKSVDMADGSIDAVSEELQSPIFRKDLPLDLVDAPAPITPVLSDEDIYEYLVGEDVHL